MTFDELITLVKRKLPGAIFLVSNGTTIEVVSRKGFRRLVACVLGVSWPQRLGPVYDIINDSYPSQLPPLIHGPYVQWYLKNEYPQAVARAQEERYNQHRPSSNRELLGQDDDGNFKFRPRFKDL